LVYAATGGYAERLRAAGFHHLPLPIAALVPCSGAAASLRDKGGSVLAIVISSQRRNPEFAAVSEQRLVAMGPPLRVLIIEDSETDAQLLLRELRRGDYDPSYERVQTAAEMRAALARREWDVVLADYTLPEFRAMAALALLQEQGYDLPFIIVSGSIGEDVAEAAMKPGAHDYQMKSLLNRLNTSN